MNLSEITFYRNFIDIWFLTINYLPISPPDHSLEMEFFILFVQ